MGLKNKILEVISGAKIAAVATAAEGMPRVRYMVTVGFEDLTLRAATRRSSNKVAQIEKNPRASISIWSGESMSDIEKGMPYVIIDAAVTLEDDLETKKAFWNPMFEKYFKGPEDPEYVVLKFTPKRIEYYNPAAGEMDVWEG